MKPNLDSQVLVSEVLGNSQKLDGGSMFGNVPRVVWSKWLEPDELGRIPLACRAMLIEIGKIKILCETGIGAFFSAPMAERFGVQNSNEHLLLSNLNKMGLSPDQIDFVILSHLHFDHAGGLLPTYEKMQQDQNYDLVFPRAKFVVGKEAWERALMPHSRDRASFIPELQEKLKKSERLLIVEGKTHKDLPQNISFYFSQGHTPGQMHCIVTGESERMLFAGDLVPGTHWVHLPVTMGYDRYPELLIDEKNDLYTNLVNDRTWLFYTHDNLVSCSKLIADERGRYSSAETKLHLSRFKI